jgi:hypothetical protein
MSSYIFVEGAAAPLAAGYPSSTRLRSRVCRVFSGRRSLVAARRASSRGHGACHEALEPWVWKAPIGSVAAAVQRPHDDLHSCSVLGMSASSRAKKRHMHTTKGNPVLWRWVSPSPMHAVACCSHDGSESSKRRVADFVSVGCFIWKDVKCTNRGKNFYTASCSHVTATDVSECVDGLPGTSWQTIDSSRQPTNRQALS